MTDGYAGYNKVCVENRIKRLACLAHIRRKFIEAQREGKKGKVSKADQAISFIAKLYGIEKRIKELSVDKKYQIRQKESAPILEKFKVWLEKSEKHTAPKTTLGKAIKYALNQWPAFNNYIEIGDYPIDNNRAENAIRPFVISRKNWLFSDTQKGAVASANLYSLIETAKANGLNTF